MKINLFGGQKTGSKIEVSAQSSVNMYAEKAEDKSTVIMRQYPGMKSWKDFSAESIVGSLIVYIHGIESIKLGSNFYPYIYAVAEVANGKAYFCRITRTDAGDYSSIASLGEMTTWTNFVNARIIAAGNERIAIFASPPNGSGSYWVYDAGLATVVTYSYTGSSNNNVYPTYLDGFIFFSHKYENRISMLDYRNPASYSTSNYYTAIAKAGAVVRAVSNNRDLYVFCAHAIILLYNAGNEGFPLVRNNSIFFEYTLVRENALTKINNNIYFAGHAENSALGIYVLSDFSVRKISTENIDDLLTLYVDHLSSFFIKGHEFIVLRNTVDSTTHTNVYDATTGLWLKDNNISSLSPGESIVSLFRTQRILCTKGSIAPDPQIFEIDPVYRSYDYIGSPPPPITTFERISGHIYGSDNKWIYHNRLLLEFVKSSAEVTVLYSDDDGATYTSNGSYSLSTGIVDIPQLGRSQDRIYKFTSSDDDELTFINAWLDATEGTF